MSRIEFTFWLIPAEPHKAQLKAAVSDLAGEFAAPDFDPHATIYHGASNKEEACQLVEKISRQFSVFDMKAEKLDQSDHYSKTFFIQFQESLAAQQICESMRANAVTPSDYVLNPHVSLLYKNIEEVIRKELCEKPIVPMTKYKFDEIWAVEYDAPWSDTAARSYRVLTKAKLNNG